jgi:hypothetical protein
VRIPKTLIILAAVVPTMLSTSASAWNARGHMTVAGIAWERMTPQARTRAISLLMRNPDYQTWVEGFPAAEQGRIAFMEAATWPDDLRGRTCKNPPAANCIRDDGYTPADASADLNIGYSDHRLRRYWHFEDLPFSDDGTPLEQPFAPNAESQISFFTQSLSDSAVSEDAKSFDLTWLLHLVGDVHQPLHATARFSSASPHGDNGGNQVVVCRPAPAKCVTGGRFAYKLHTLWDDAIGTSKSVRSARKKADGILQQLSDPQSFLSHAISGADLNAPPSAWLQESSGLAKRHVYMAPIGPGRGPYFPTAAYRANAGSIAEQQIAIAGARLANLLNSSLQ